MATAKRDLTNPPVQGPHVPSLLNVRQVAELLSVSETTVYRLKRRGEIGFVKVGASLRFRPADVADYQNRRSVTALGYAAPETPEPPRLKLAFPPKRRRASKMQEA
jgi:excisionase family DNA binding protein